MLFSSYQILCPESAFLTFLAAVPQATQLISDLQTLAHNSGHPVPLLIVIDQENGGVNSLYDETYIRQFPSAMALAATGDKQLTRRIARATAEEMQSCGINWILGPVLDVLSNARNQPLGVRSFGEDPAIVSSFGVENMKGLQEGGVATCGKHFPSYGNLEVSGALNDMPTITDSLESLSQNALIPFRKAIDAGIDAMMVGGVAMSSNHLNVMHACLSEHICRDLLRTEMGFQGVVVSECLEMEALSRNIGISGGTVMAFKAGCDLLLTCRSLSVQEEAINGLTAGLDNGMIEKSRVQESCARILALKSKYTSWEKVFSTPGIENLNRIRAANTTLSSTAYKSTIRVVRDSKKLLPLSRVTRNEDEILLLTPLVKPLPASSAFRQYADEAREQSLSPRPNYATDNMVMTGERVFRNFGRLLAKRRNGKVIHASYTANGVRTQHESLINRAKAVIVLTADAGRNKYQVAFAKHVSMLCRLSEDSDGKVVEKPCAAVAVSSPFDLISEQSIGTYVCTYDFTEVALQSLVTVLCGDTGSATVRSPPIPNKVRRSSQPARQQWMVESYDDGRDSTALLKLFAAISATTRANSDLLRNASAETFSIGHNSIKEAHFVIRNSSTKELIGFCATYYQKHDRIASVGAVVVHPGRRNQSAGFSLMERAIRFLISKTDATTLKLGTMLPSVFPGIPSFDSSEHRRLCQWFLKFGWNVEDGRKISKLTIPDLALWDAPEGLGQSLTVKGVKYDLVHGEEYIDGVMKLVKVHAPVDVQVMYELALKNKEGCAIIRGKKIDDASIVATVLLFRSASALAHFVPQVNNGDHNIGGISSPVMAAGLEDQAILLQGLILLGIRQLKKQGMKSLHLDLVRRPQCQAGKEANVCRWMSLRHLQA